MMGLNGAFLTGDLFNLFVFFEVLLAASYGLALRGVGTTRVRAGLHYIVVNLAASLLFLIGVALIYGIAGTLNMADLAQRFGALEPRAAYAVRYGRRDPRHRVPRKGRRWPFNFWLPSTYSVAVAPVAAVFAMHDQSRRVCLPARRHAHERGPGRRFDSWLGAVLPRLATLIAGAIGMLAAQHLARLVSHAVVVSTGTCSRRSGSASKR